MREYMDDFSDRAEKLADTPLENCKDIEDRKKEVNDMVEEYFEKVGDVPNSATLQKLADYLLIEQLKDKDVDKVTNNDFPILSEIQQKRRARKQPLMLSDTIDFLNTKLHKEKHSLSKTPNKKVEY